MRTAPVPAAWGFGRVFDRATVARLRAEPGEWVLVRTYWNTKNTRIASGGLIRPADIDVLIGARMVQRVCRVEVWARAIPGAR